MASLVKHEMFYREATLEFLQNMRQLLYLDKAAHETELEFVNERLKLIQAIIDERNQVPLPEIAELPAQVPVEGPMR